MWRDDGGAAQISVDYRVLAATILKSRTERFMVRIPRWDSNTIWYMVLTEPRMASRPKQVGRTSALREVTADSRRLR